MNPVLQKLFDHGTPPDNSSVVKLDPKSSKELVRRLFKGNNQEQYIKRDAPETIGPNQIWTLKSQYTDFLGAVVSLPTVFHVLTFGDTYEYENEKFINVYKLSSFIEMAFEDDIVIKDSSIIGFPFLVERWNCQPAHLSIFDEYISNFDLAEGGVPSADIVSSDANSNEINFFSIKQSIRKDINNITDYISVLGDISNHKKLSANILSLIELYDANIKLQRKVISLSNTINERFTSDSGASQLAFVDSDISFGADTVKKLAKYVKSTASDVNEFDEVVGYMKTYFSKIDNSNSNIKGFKSDLVFNDGEFGRLFSLSNVLKNSINQLNEIFTEKTNLNFEEIGKRKNFSNVHAAEQNFHLGDIYQFREFEVRNGSYIANSFTSFISSIE